MNKPPRIEEVTVTVPAGLVIRWTTGETMQADIGDWMLRFALLEPLKDSEVFKKARVGWYGHSVEWSEDIELGADHLYTRCKAQAGEPSPEEFNEWMKRNDLSLSTAAEALGMTRRMITHYRTGSKRIPRNIWLACIGWETLKHKHAA
ncbi:hypothetical protein Gbem_0416 [Citrifermentans bemidjiense Bem]|uniref:DUF2442 domain-containing protein n=1 Tax=Citrifermentans bemidjiense (strain ATCC BAA-1014 / DSM 16622 / JCM 12645 / Bem) TaxID=404380 RepID=B5EBH6_CITBB|nr:DUF2442 domain-containing protein [Citrifermentans bemidjiense]ACH37445.2 hypothetical protein Gbem_0416 [Citrifermentans bemidjiense Bem]